MSNETPLMQQFHEFKIQCPDAVLFMRCGDFYEMFHEDARVVARELQLTLTSRNKNSEDPVPMAGIPYHAYEDYAAKLISKGYKIAICEQIENPKEAKGLVKRAITQVLTPGTVTLTGVLQPGRNNFLGLLFLWQKQLFFTYLDVSTGEAFCAFFPLSGTGLEKLRDEVLKVHPAELLLQMKLTENPDFNELVLKKLLERSIHIIKTEEMPSRQTPLFSESVTRQVLFAAGVDEKHSLRFPFELMLNYLERCAVKTTISSIQLYSSTQRLLIDPASVRNLELLQCLPGSSGTSLAQALDHTLSAPGSRMFKQILLNPLVDAEEINERLNIVETLCQNRSTNHELREIIKQSSDLQRIQNRILNQLCSGRDLLAVRNTLELIPTFKATLKQIGLDYICQKLPELQELCELLQKTISEDAPARIGDGNLFKRGFSPELDHCFNLLNEADTLISQLEEKERNKTGLKNLKIKSNRVFGYYFELPKSLCNQAPAYFIRRQTLTNAERFITEELKELETGIFEAENRIKNLEAELFSRIRNTILDQSAALQSWAQILAFVDVMGCFAENALRFSYCRPEFTDKAEFVVTNGRHPVVELNTENFVPNDHYLEAENGLIQIITGPNMGGKSTYLRQCALIAILAQAGSFVPADYCKMQIFDRIFTRIGASDDLSTGKSTFMVEMAETAYILANATTKSLILLDEVGRGTATLDGLSIAWSLIEYITYQRLYTLRHPLP
jgi:DNA mismatch repair protein MutS